jgi:hypothetical protein
MSGISSISGFSALSYRPLNSGIPLIEGMDEVEDDLETVVETAGDAEPEAGLEEEGSHDAEEGSGLGSEIDAWG